MHLIAELMVFLVMPISIIACSIMNMDSLKDKPQASLFLAFAICSLGEILIGGLIFGRISVQTWRWYKNRRQETQVQPFDAHAGTNNADIAGIVFKDIKQGDGQGKHRLGTSIELGQTLNALLYASLIRQEYIDACEKEENESTVMISDNKELLEDIGPINEDTNRSLKEADDKSLMN